MQLLKKVKFSNGYWVIYKLDDDEARELNTTKKYVVSQCEFSDYWLKHHMNTLEGRVETFRKYVEGEKHVYYEGVFETELEAYYHIKYVEASTELERLKNSLKEFAKKHEDPVKPASLFGVFDTLNEDGIYE